MLKLFIGYDSKETVAWHVLVHSIMRRTRKPLSITPIGNEVLPESIWWRPRGPHDSTEFSNARFLTPYLADYQGWAAFMDCDMVCTTDIDELFALADDQYAVMVRKHQYIPEHSTKFLGQEQSRYHRKNWSSLMLINCGHPETRNLTLEYVNNSPGLDLHGFAWCSDQSIGSLPTDWNHLVTHKGAKHAAA